LLFLLWIIIMGTVRLKDLSDHCCIVGRSMVWKCCPQNRYRFRFKQWIQTLSTSVRVCYKTHLKICSPHKQHNS
jgi:hypothetical protein